jgi:hypothetical protein
MKVLIETYQCILCLGLIQGDKHKIIPLPGSDVMESDLHAAERISSAGGPLGNRPVPPIWHNVPHGHVGKTRFAGFIVAEDDDPPSNTT